MTTLRKSGLGPTLVSVVTLLGRRRIGVRVDSQERPKGGLRVEGDGEPVLVVVRLPGRHVTGEDTSLRR